MLGSSYSIQDNWGVSRGFFEAVTLGSLAFFILTGIVFWLIGRRNLANGAVVSGDLLAIDPEIGGGGGMTATATAPAAPEA